MRGGVLPVKAGRCVLHVIFQSLALLTALSFFMPAPLVARQIQVGGKAYVDLLSVGEGFGMRAYWLQGYQTFRLRSQWTTVDVGKNSRMLWMNRMPIYLGFPTVESKGQLFVAQADYQHVLKPILTPQVFESPPTVRRIVIDAGHGGKDSGACNHTYGLWRKTSRWMLRGA